MDIIDEVVEQAEIQPSDGTGACFFWDEWNLEIEVIKVMTGFRNSVHGEFNIYRNRERVISFDAIEMTSRNERLRLVKDLRENHDSPDITFSWERIVEFICAFIITKHREDEPAIQIKDIPATLNNEYRIAPIILEHEATVAWGMPGCGKSVLGCLTAVMTHDAKMIPGLDWEVIPGNVLYLDFEDFQGVIKQRITALRTYLWKIDGQPMLDQDIVYKRMSRPLAESRETIQRLITNYNISLLICDGLGYAIGGDTQKEQSTLAFWQAVRSFNTTFFGLDHPAKNGTEDSPYGSMYKLAGMRSGFLIKGSKPSPYQLNVGMVHKKVNSSIEIPDQAISFEFVYENNNFKKSLLEIRVTPSDIKTIPEMAEHRPIADRMADYLFDVGPKTTKQIASALGVNQDSARALLNKDTRFIKDDDKWSVSE